MTDDHQISKEARERCERTLMRVVQAFLKAPSNEQLRAINDEADRYQIHWIDEHS